MIAIWVDPNLPAAAASFITLGGARIYLLPHVQAPVTVLTVAVVHRAGPVDGFIDRPVAQSPSKFNRLRVTDKTRQTGFGKGAIQSRVM